MKSVILNIEGSGIRVLTTDGKRVTGWSSMPLPPGLVKDGLIVEPTQVGELIEDFLAEEGLSKKKVIASLSGMRSVPRLLSLPKIAPSLVPEAIRHASEREMPVPLDELYLWWRDLGGNGSERQFFVIGVPRALVDAELQTLDHAGIKVHFLALKPIALARAVNRDEAVIIDLESENSDIVLVVGGIPIIMRTLILGGEGVTPEEKVRQTASEVTRTVDFYNSSHPESPIGSATPVFVTGGLAEDEAIVNLLGGAISGPVETLDPAITRPAELPVAEYAVNIGLALNGTARNGSKRGTGFPALDLTMVPDTYRARRPLWRSLTYTLLAVLVVALLFPAYLLTRGGAAEVDHLALELANLTQQLVDVRQTVDQANRITIEAVRLGEEARTVLGTEESFADRLGLVFDAPPAGVSLTSITMSDDAIGLNGMATTPFSAADYAALLEETESFATVHIASLTMAHGSADASVTTFSIIAK